MEIKINNKLINILLAALIVYLVYQTRELWVGIFSALYKILLPFVIAFIIAYALSPIVNYLIKKKIPKGLSITIVFLFFILLFGFLLCLITPVLVEQTKSIFNSIIVFINDISINHHINFSNLQGQLSNIFNNVIAKLGAYISNGAISIIGASISIVSDICIILAALVYFMADMDKIKNAVKKYYIKKNKKIYCYLSILNQELQNYLSGFIKICIISFFQYTIVYALIGHPDSLMLGTLASVGNLIPYFGGIIANIIAAITAFVISPELFIKTCIVFMVFSAIDGNIINPLVYGKTNQVHPLIIIFSVFAGGILFGIIGIIISLPLAILVIATYKYFKEDIEEFSEKKLASKKNNNKKSN